MARRLLVCACSVVLLAAPAAARAAVKPFDKLTCATPDGAGGARFCGAGPGASGQPSSSLTLVPTFDGVPLDANVALPPASKGDGPFPLIVIAHGYGGQKNGFDYKETGAGESGYVGSLKDLADQGYAVLTATARGFNGSCGNTTDRLQIGAACAAGYLRLDDYRFEAMDIEYLAGRLVDEGIAKPDIGVGGESYGGGVSLELAVLRDRMCDDMYAYDAAHHCSSLVPWTSPGGTPMSIAAATPIVPWSDLVYAIVPNGRTLDYTITNPYVDAAHPGDDASPLGAEKQSFVSGLYALGQQTGSYQTPSPTTSDPFDADLTTWFARVNAGEPYTDPVAQHIVDVMTRFRSPYDMPADARGPAPLFISNGWTDDLFPPEEALRFYNRERGEFPHNPIALLFANHGHQRGANSDADIAIVRAHVQAEFAHYLKGDASVPAPAGVQAYLTQCPAPAGASAGPISAPDWNAIHPGEVRFLAAQAASVPAQGDPDENKVSDPVLSGQNPCGTVSGFSDAAGTAAYRLPKVAGSGYTLLGSPTVIAKYALSGGGSPELVGRLWDVAPDGSETLVAKGVYRPSGSGVEVFQLHADGWRFAAGHTPRLELLQSDEPYVRAADGSFSITVSDLQLRLPTAEKPDCTQILSPAAPVLPEAASGLSRVLAPGVAAGGGGPCSLSSAKGKYRIRFGAWRHRLLRAVRSQGIGAVLHCSAKCKVTAVIASGTKRLGRLTRSAKGNFAVHVRLTQAGLRRLSRHRASRLRLAVTIADSHGKRLARRSSGYVVRHRA